MSCSLKVSQETPIQTHHCHQKKSKFDAYIHIVEKISAIALGAFSFYTNWKLFIPYFFVGVCVGIYSYNADKKSCMEHSRASSCTHDLLEQLTKTKLPPIISLIANIAAAVCHIDHHSTVFVPITAISIGNWVGKTATFYGVLGYQKIATHLNKPSSESLATC